MVFIGESSVGKSSILNRYVDEIFDENYLATIGVDFKFKEISLPIDDKEVTFRV